MNLVLTREIIKDFFENIGIGSSNSFFSIKKPEFLIEEKLKFLEEDKEIYKNIWCVHAKISELEMSIILADISFELEEYIAIVQANDFNVFGLKFVEENNILNFIVNINENWIPVDKIIQGKFLVGMNEFFSQFPIFKKKQEYKKIYQLLKELVENSV